ncbi:TRAP transporter substrate-binding protein [Thermus scotoductus]|uniref:TRAP transporter substrate-binding protein n=1 Tax=Thermus scotoductus TaxID=37636 RepID=A0A430S7A7_THESC|nr:TAXI family TRAP transporter solute-binding subunit [Thermus scotoductus]RTG92841.1 TRAP transporter substrate-binding protein [Thermus scotoductus]RTH07281.1 TRAP transporter substrate-binding protein [Thermus scotoductus]RTH09781.1 TRAP transporter substrate-binding protein [Thermus scotoductus]RTH09868.1 TRAP transporter substrate-binding protein [Thermus scotoductus]RTH16194.1 TRAP transporter substrate-binding protein [Thermus scotoductus]
MKRALLILLALAGLGLAQKPKVVIATGGVGGVYFYYGTTLAEIWNKAGVAEAQAIQTAASIDNLLLLENRTSGGTYYCGTVLPDSAYLAYTGQHDRFKEKPAKSVRILFAMYPNFLHIVTREGTGIRVVQDLKGKRVSTGAPGSGTEVEALLVLQAAGISPKDFAKQERLGAQESANALAEGNIDAFFWSGGLPTGAITELSAALARKGQRIHLVPLDPKSTVVQTFQKRFPGLAGPGVIPKAVYGTRADTPTLTFWNLFVCPQSLPEEAAYVLTKATFENLATLRQAVAAARNTSLENAVRFVGGTIPYHEGALRYFREAGALK